MTKPISDEAALLFWSYALKTTTCWFWGGQKLSTGYGRFEHGGVKHLAHRLAYELDNGPIPDGMHVLHSCDVPACMNPAHLFLGTAADNMRDKCLKGRHRGPSYAAAGGERNTNAKLTQARADEIRDIFSKGGHTILGLAKELGLSYTMVRSIIHNETYTDTQRQDPSWNPNNPPTEDYRAKLTKEQVVEIRSIWSQTPRPTQEELGAAYGVSSATISEAIRNKIFHDPNYVPPPLPEPKLSPEQIDQIKTLYNTTQVSKGQLARQFGVSPTTVRNICGTEKRLWTLDKLHEFAKLTQEQADEIRALYATGHYSQSALARQFGIHQVTVSDIILNRTYKVDDGPTMNPLPQKSGKRKASKLTIEQAREARRLYAEGSHNQYQLSEMFGLSQQSMSELLRGKSYVE